MARRVPQQEEERRALLESALISPVLDESGQIQHFLAIKEDITRRREAEEAAGPAKSGTALVESVDVGISLVDRDHNILMVNRKLADLLSLRVGEVLGAKCYREFEGRDEFAPIVPASGR